MTLRTFRAGEELPIGAQVSAVRRTVPVVAVADPKTEATGVVRVLQQAEPPAGALPTGLLRLREIAHALTVTGGAAGRNLRVVVTVPTLRLAGVTAALGAALAPVDCSGCAHRQLQAGVRVAGWVSGRFTDAELVDVSGDALRFGGITLRGHQDTVHRLPAGFPERRDTRLADEIRAEVAAALRCGEGVAGQRLSAAAAHPVVVAGEPSAFREDLAVLAGASTGLHLLGRLHAGTHLTDWFRYPVLLMGSVPDLHDAPWVTELRPRLVILTGSAGWIASSRRNWPDVPILAILSRRSPAACDTTALMATAGWTAPESLPAPLGQRLRPGAGLETICLVEPESADVDEDLW